MIIVFQTDMLSEIIMVGFMIKNCNENKTKWDFKEVI